MGGFWMDVDYGATVSARGEAWKFVIAIKLWRKPWRAHPQYLSGSRAVSGDPCRSNAAPR